MRHRQTDPHTQRKTHTHRDRETDRQTHTHTHTHTHQSHTEAFRGTETVVSAAV